MTTNPPTESTVPRATLGEILGRALRLRCPRCGQRRLFAGWFRMHEACPHCRLHYERAPGYFLGSTYINYGVTVIAVMVVYFALHFGVGWSNTSLAAPLAGFCMLFPLYFFRYARSLWLAIDYYVDPTSFDPAKE
jgi:uncharacterized protein (DUF983 family)